jgi:hypothetical protein
MSELQPSRQWWKKFPSKMVAVRMRFFSQAIAVCRLIAAFAMVAAGETICFCADSMPF